MRTYLKSLFFSGLLCLITANVWGQMVTTTANSGEGSLRQAIADAATGSTITFALEPGAVIRLNTQITINKSLNLIGPGADKLTISGDSDNDGSGQTRLFNITDGTLTVRNIRMELGSSGSQGGAIYVTGSSSTLDVADCEFVDNDAARAGGAISVDNRATLTLERSLFLSNFVTTPASTNGGGGAVFLNTDREVLIQNCTFTQNSQRGFFASLGGGAILGLASNNDQSRFNIINNTFYRNDDIRFSANIADAIMMESDGGDARLTMLNNIFRDNGLNSVFVDNNYDLESKSNIADDNPDSFTGDDETGNAINLGNLALNGGAVRNHSIPDNSDAVNFSDNPTPDLDTRRFVRNGRADAGAYDTNTETNLSPSITSAAPTSATEEVPYTYNITLEDPENDNLVIVPVQKPDWLTFTVTNNGTNNPTARLSGTPDDPELENSPYAVALQLTDGINLTRQEFNVSIAPVNDPPELVNNNTINVNEGGSETVTQDILLVTDVEQSAANITYSVRAQPQSGRLELNGQSNPATFTQDQINRSQLVYRHNGTNTTSDSFRAEVSDGDGGNISAFTVNISITPVNDTPVLVNNQGLSVDQGGLETIISDMLLVTDEDNSNAEITYTVTRIPTNGDLRRGNNRITLNQQFTQADINNNRITYANDGESADEDFFRFVVRDGSGGSLPEARFDILVAEVDNPPVVAEGIPDQTTEEDVLYSYTIPGTVFRDPGDVLTYRLEHVSDPRLPAWIQFDPDTRTISGTPLNQDVGEEDLEVIATDRSGQSASTTFTLTVVNVNDAPFMVELNADSLEVGTNAGFLVGRFIVEDEDLFDSHTYSLVQGEGSEFNELFDIDQNRLLVAGGVSLDTAGNYSIRVRATDQAGAFIEDQFQIVVYEPRFLGLERLIYNLLTPGGTDDNNTWGIAHLSLQEEVRVLVLDRAGTVVFQTTDPNEEWDGNVDGREAPDGTYYYVIEILGNSPQRVTGTLLLER